MFWESIWAGSCLWPALIVHDIAMSRVKKETNADDMLPPLGRYVNIQTRIILGSLVMETSRVSTSNIWRSFRTLHLGLYACKCSPALLNHDLSSIK